MPKLKTKKAVAKRFKLTPSGKIKHYPVGKSHLLTSKTRKRTRGLRRPVTLEDSKKRKYIKRLLPYA
jgi:large subunit ribosomal protein L35